MRNGLLLFGGAGLALLVFKKKFFPNGTARPTKSEPTKEEIKRMFPVTPSTEFNPLVKRMQQALINFGGMPKLHILNSGGADGYFGDGTKRALEAFGVSGSAVNELTYAEILKKGSLL